MGRSPPYSSKNEGFWDRSLRQRTKHKRRLTDDGSLEAYEIPKPKGMWWRTYYRLQRRAQAAERRAADDFIMFSRRLLKTGEGHIELSVPEYFRSQRVIGFMDYPKKL